MTQDNSKGYVDLRDQPGGYQGTVERDERGTRVVFCPYMPLDIKIRRDQPIFASTKQDQKD